MDSKSVLYWIIVFGALTAIVLIVRRVAAAPKADPDNTVTNREKLKTVMQSVLIFFLVVSSIGIYAAILIPAIGGNRPSSQNTMWTAIWTSILFYVLFRRLGRKGWMGAIAGFSIGFLVLITADVVARTKQNDPEYILNHNPGYLTLKKYHPTEFQRIKTELDALAKEHPISR